MLPMLKLLKSERSKLRRLAFLPRIGITVDVAGCQLTYKQAPMLETLLNLRGRGVNLKNLYKVLGEQFDEIRFPVLKTHLAPVAGMSNAGGRLKRAAAKASTKAKKAKAEAAATIVDAEVAKI